jgi:hypothetical protein
MEARPIDLPLGDNTFENIVMDDLLYVDKIAYLAEEARF